MNYMSGVVICCHQRNDTNASSPGSGSGTSRNSGTSPAIAHTSQQDGVRNCPARPPAPPNAPGVDPEIYQQATSLETLIGYLYLTDSQRLTELLQELKLEQI